MAFVRTIKTENKIDELKAIRENGSRIQGIEDLPDGTTKIFFN